MTSPPEHATLLALDGGSRRLSVAVGNRTETFVERSAPVDRSSSTLLRLVDDCLRALGLGLADLGGILALRGPGSFTGLRVTLALAQGLRQASGLPAGTLSTFEALAAQVGSDRRTVAVVQAGRGAWNAQRFADGSPLGRPARLSDAELVAAAREVDDPLTLVGFDLEAVLPELAGSRLLDARPLAAVALRLAARADWDPASLTAPLYLAAAPATEPSTNPRATGPSRPPIES